MVVIKDSHGPVKVPKGLSHTDTGKSDVNTHYNEVVTLMTHIKKEPLPRDASNAGLRSRGTRRRVDT